MPHHVVLLGRDPSLAIALQALLEHAGDVSALEVVDDWRASSAEEVDAVIVDLPTRRRLPTVERIRDGYRGRLVLLLDPADDPAPGAPRVPGRADLGMARPPLLPGSPTRSTPLAGPARRGGAGGPARRAAAERGGGRAGPARRGTSPAPPA